MGDDNVDLPLVRGAERLVDGVAAAEDLGLVLALGVKFAHRLDVLLEVVSECEPHGSNLLFENGGDTGVFGSLCHVEDPTKETDTGREDSIVRELQRLSDRLQVRPELLRGVEACEGNLSV